MFKKWLRDRRARRAREIAKAVRMELGNSGWEKFLPPVALRDSIYLVTENGSIYVVREDINAGMETFVQIRRG